jgi:hypothetical protein
VRLIGSAHTPPLSDPRADASAPETAFGRQGTASMALTTLVDVRPGLGGDGGPVVALRGAPTNGAGVADAPDVAHLLANRLVAGLDDRPFRPTADQLARVWGGELVRGERRENRARIAAGRYAALLTDHVVQDVAVEGGPGAYALIWLCARRAFIASMSSEDLEAPGNGEVSRWENDGGRAA